LSTVWKLLCVDLIDAVHYDNIIVVVAATVIV